MPRPLTRAQALQNAAFLRELRRTGNVRQSCATLGIHRATLTKRRAAHPAFAAEWDAALAMAHAALRENPDLPQKPPAEPRVVRGRGGRLQLRRPVPARMTRADEQAFLAALSATANVRWSAAAAGFSHAAFYARRRASPAFAREMRLALEIGYERVEMALLASWQVESHADDAWRHNVPPPVPAMTVNQALQLLYLHQKEARLLAEPAHFKRRRGESDEAQSYRYAVMYRAAQARDREAYRIAEVARAAAREAESPHEPPPPSLPALEQVTGWSTADPATTPHDPTRALFGGWRLADWAGRK